MHSVLVYNVTHSDLILGVARGGAAKTTTTIVVGKPDAGGDGEKRKSYGSAAAAACSSIAVQSGELLLGDGDSTEIVHRRESGNEILDHQRTVLPELLGKPQDSSVKQPLGSGSSSNRVSILDTEKPSLFESDDTVFARPKFSYVEPIAREVLKRFQNAISVEFASLHFDSNSYDRVMVGFTFASNPILAAWSTLHLRGSADPPDEKQEEAHIISAYIPLSAQLIPEWLRRTSHSNNARYILLVCGVGRPQDRDANLLGNSTRACAELIKMFLKNFLIQKYAQDEKIDVKVCDSSGYDVFDYNENVSFVRGNLMPQIELIRRAAAKSSTEWRQNMEVTVALTEGSPARLGALSAALRPYRPWYAHLCQLKTFWHEKRLLTSDVRFYSFERVETTPPLVVEHLFEDVFRMAAEELRKYRDEFLLTVDESELQSFWLRKSSRPVISVLVVNEGRFGCDRFRFYRGINLEVSQPTGSLCSERNAIGSALAANPRMNRRDVVCVAVLALPKLTALNEKKRMPEVKRFKSESIGSYYDLGEGADLNPLGPCGACTEWLKKIAEVNPDFKVMTFRDISCRECFIREIE